MNFIIGWNNYIRIFQTMLFWWLISVVSSIVTSSNPNCLDKLLHTFVLITYSFVSIIIHKLMIILN